MPSQKRIGEDQYTRPEYTEQDIISSDIDSIKEKLNNFVRVYPDFYKDIPCSTWIKYVTFEGLYRAGGILIANKSPKYLVLKNQYWYSLVVTFLKAELWGNSGEFRGIPEIPRNSAEFRGIPGNSGELRGTLHGELRGTPGKS